MHALLCCLYVSGGLSYMAQTPAAFNYRSLYWRYDISQVVNPYGIAEVGYAREFGRFTLELAARHESSIPVADFGQNTLEFRARFYPWRDAE